MGVGNSWTRGKNIFTQVNNEFGKKNCQAPSAYIPVAVKVSKSSSLIDEHAERKEYDFYWIK